MGNYANMRITSIPESDLITPSSDQRYPLGTEINTVDQTSATPVVNTYVYVKASGALTAYVPLVLNYSGTAGSEILTAGTPIVLAAPGKQVVVPQVAFTSGYYGFVQKGGNATAALANETKAVGDMLQLISGGATLVVDGSTGSTVYSVNSCAVSKSAVTAAGNRSVYLIGREAVIASS